jgi:hypothetical protein
MKLLPVGTKVKITFPPDVVLDHYYNNHPSGYTIFQPAFNSYTSTIGTIIEITRGGHTCPRYTIAKDRNNTYTYYADWVTPLVSTVVSRRS